MASPWSPDENIEDEVNDRACGGEEGVFLVQSRALVAAPTPSAATTRPTTLTPPAAPARTAAAALAAASGKRKWSRASHKAVGNAEPSLQLARCNQPAGEENAAVQPQVSGNQDTSARKKISKFFAPKAEKDSDVTEKSLSKRKLQKSSDKLEDDSKPLAANKVLKDDEEDDDDFVAPSKRKTLVKPPPSKRLKASANGDDEDERMDEDDKTPSKAAGRGRGGRGAGATPGGRGRGLAGRRFMNFGERKDPPHKGEKEVPEGAPDCLAGLTFVLSGTLDSLEREEASDLIKRYGGRVTGAISKKTSYLLADEDIGGVKSNKAKDLGIPFLTEDDLFDMIWKSKPAKALVNKHEDSNN